MAKVSTPEKEKHIFVTDHRTDPMSVIITNNTENEKILEFSESSQPQRNEDSEETERISLMSLDSGTKRGTSRKQHWKSQSMGDTVQQTTNSVQTSNIISQEEEPQEQPTFSANRELWQRRATSQTLSLIHI